MAQSCEAWGPNDAQRCGFHFRSVVWRDLWSGGNAPDRFFGPGAFATQARPGLATRQEDVAVILRNGVGN